MIKLLDYIIYIYYTSFIIGRLGSLGQFTPWKTNLQTNSRFERCKAPPTARGNTKIASTQYALIMLFFRKAHGRALTDRCCSSHLLYRVIACQHIHHISASNSNCSNCCQSKDITTLKDAQYGWSPWSLPTTPPCHLSPPLDPRTPWSFRSSGPGGSSRKVSLIRLDLWYDILQLDVDAPGITRSSAHSSLAPLPDPTHPQISEERRGDPGKLALRHPPHPFFYTAQCVKN